MSLEFVDTNVLLYAYDPSAGARHDAARDLVGALGRERRGALSVQVLQEFYVNATRKIAVPLAPDQARDVLRVLGRWPAHSPLAHDVLVAGQIAEEHTLSFWDAMIVRSAEQLGCAVLWTEDLNAGQRIRGLTVANPF
ncbi:MAG: PIN domain-containing protein [Bifidobacteriaceae bacterium]|jgi:predicted nucleic acid-binding protein|nr:PIN domain-containing protein [Bifidobacteriaceae bacterium]